MSPTLAIIALGFLTGDAYQIASILFHRTEAEAQPGHRQMHGWKPEGKGGEVMQGPVQQVQVEGESSH